MDVKITRKDVTVAAQRILDFLDNPCGAVHTRGYRGSKRNLRNPPPTIYHPRDLIGLFDLSQIDESFMEGKSFMEGYYPFKSSNAYLRVCLTQREGMRSFLEENYTLNYCKRQQGIVMVNLSVDRSVIPRSDFTGCSGVDTVYNSKVLVRDGPFCLSPQGYDLSQNPFMSDFVVKPLASCSAGSLDFVREELKELART